MVEVAEVLETFLRCSYFPTWGVAVDRGAVVEEAAGVAVAASAAVADLAGSAEAVPEEEARAAAGRQYAPTSLCRQKSRSQNL